MAPRSQQAIIVAAIAVGVAGIAGIAALEGWLTLPGSAEPSAIEPPVATPAPAQRPRIAASPAESLSPGETIVEPPAKPAPTAPPASQPAPVKPSYAQAPAPERRDPRRSCPNCGEISSTTYRQFDTRGAWEVRVRFDDGTRATMRYPTDPGFRVGDRVVMSNGRLRRD